MDFMLCNLILTNADMNYFAMLLNDLDLDQLLLNNLIPSM